jgi:hypothetical protein
MINHPVIFGRSIIFPVGVGDPRNVRDGRKSIEGMVESSENAVFCVRTEQFRGGLGVIPGKEAVIFAEPNV